MGASSFFGGGGGGDAGRNVGAGQGKMARAVGKNAEAGLRPERVRRDESRLYVADFAMRRGMDGREAEGLEEARL